MDLLPPLPRRVFVLGREAGLDVGAVARPAAADGAELVLLSVGYPVSASQQRILSEAVGLAERLRIMLDAVLVPDVRDLPTHLLAQDEVQILGSPNERKRIERAIAAGGMPLPSPTPVGSY